jgi:choline dehydrogenase-like flavoprotein
MTASGTAGAADVCIVGSGPAGAILAASLAGRGHDVVVLEAGPRFAFESRTARMDRALRPEHDDLDVWDMGGPRDRYTSSGPYEYDLNRHRVKGIGGTTLHWGGMTPRLHPEDFEMETRHGIGRDWPISYEDLEPYYLRAEEAMGVAGEPNRFSGPRSGPYPLAPAESSYSDEILAEACSSLGIELVPKPLAINTEPYDGRSQCVGYGTCSPVCPSGAKYDASVHIRKAEERGARVVTRAPVQRLEHDDSGERVVAAVHATPDGDTRRQRARQFVVACGAVESIRLLLLSTSPQYPDGLANSSGVLGEYFMEHPGGGLVGRVDEPTRQHLVGYGTSMCEQFYDHDSGPEGSFLIDFGNNAGPEPVDLALEQLSDSGRIIAGDVLAPFEGDPWGDALQERLSEEYGGYLRCNGWVEQPPRRENKVSLDPSKTDDHGNPVPDLTLSFDGPESVILERVRDLCREILEECGATEIHGHWSPDDPYVGSHHMGGIRMGRDPAESIVNAELRAHDLSNLFVSSSGVFPTCGAANPTLTIAALTLRLADHIHGRLSDG